MQKGSLVSPSAIMMDNIPQMIKRFNCKFVPAIPTKDSIFVCEEGPYLSPSGRLCVKVDGLKVFYMGEMIHLNIYLFVEVQPPMDINIEEIINENIVTS